MRQWFSELASALFCVAASVVVAHWRALRRQIEHSRIAGRGVPLAELRHRLRTWRATHDQISDSIRCLNRCFGLALLLNLLYYCFVLVELAYTTLRFVRDGQDLIAIFSASSFFLQAASHVLIVFYAADRTSNEVRFFTLRLNFDTFRLIDISLLLPGVPNGQGRLRHQRIAPVAVDSALHGRANRCGQLDRRCGPVDAQDQRPGLLQSRPQFISYCVSTLAIAVSAKTDVKITVFLLLLFHGRCCRVLRCGGSFCANSASLKRATLELGTDPPMTLTFL